MHSGIMIGNTRIIDIKSAKISGMLPGFTAREYDEGTPVGMSGQSGRNIFAAHARLIRHVHVSRDGKRLAGERVRIVERCP